MSPLVLAFLIGVVAGLRSMTAPAAVSWAARAGWLPLAGTPLAVLGYSAMPYILSLLAIGELIADKLPLMRSRKELVGFLGRIGSGALSGAAIGAPGGALLTGLLAGVVGSIAGTLGGYEARVLLAKAFGKDLPAALLEDAVAVIGAYAIVSQLV